jgi:hypothetical protein
VERGGSSRRHQPPTLDNSLAHMPSPKDGKAGTVVAPVDPDEAQEADIADPGKVEEIKAQQRRNEQGKYSSVRVAPFKPPQSQPETAEERSWIEVEMVDEEKNPVPGLKYRITLPDNSVAEGTLSDKGFARVDGIAPGTCRITFPGLDQDAWEKA